LSHQALDDLGQTRRVIHDEAFLSEALSCLSTAPVFGILDFRPDFLKMRSDFISHVGIGINHPLLPHGIRQTDRPGLLARIVAVLLNPPIMPPGGDGVRLCFT
jgi:hypothetical protein